MNYENILIHLEDGILTLTLNRPDKLNALNMALIREVGHAVAEAQSNDLVRGILITGSGPKAFAAGADIAEFVHFTPAEARDMSAAGHAVFNTIEQSEKPVMAAVNGFALGGGCELAMSCHIRICSEQAKFGQPEINLGVIPGYGGTQRLLRHVGYSKGLELLLTADLLGAQEAFRLGLVSQVTSSEELLPVCRGILQKIKSKSPLVVAQIIACANAWFHKTEDGFELEMEEFGRCFVTSDFREGTAAFLEKRKAVFTGS